ncbi:hypothetical protein D3C84_1253750 [compost metagenome]
MITSTRKACAVDRLGLGKVENTEANSRLAVLPRTMCWVCSKSKKRLLYSVYTSNAPQKAPATWAKI